NLFYYCTTTSTSNGYLNVRYDLPSKSSLRVGIAVIRHEQVHLFNLAIVNLFASLGRNRVSKTNALEAAMDEVNIRHVNVTREGSFLVTSGTRMPVTFFPKWNLSCRYIVPHYAGVLSRSPWLILRKLVYYIGNELHRRIVFSHLSSHGTYRHSSNTYNRFNTRKSRARREYLWDRGEAVDYVLITVGISLHEYAYYKY
ncbi:hypothetical protein J1614_004231, partial [Plenodomus biglobosus]